ncbi:FKBP-type peptidyl-prolyl cis-trans isomerase [Marinoscillum furvescens]|nr:FKBP-type peptidyl-prolyl cis-trans isomerase [Marinoscillum furvescens]
MITIGFLGACGEITVENPPTQDEQLSLDLELIEAYLTEKGYESVDTLDSKVHVVILDEGTGAPISESDQVTMDYVGHFLDGEVFDTSIDSVAIENDIYDSTKVYQPIRFTYSSNGWTMGKYIKGFQQGTSYALGKINVGGGAEMVIPSYLGFTTNYALAGEVVVFRVYPTSVKSQ